MSHEGTESTLPRSGRFLPVDHLVDDPAQAHRVEIGPEGVMKIHPVGDISPYEQDLLDAAIPDIQANIKKGVEFANQA